MRQVLKIVSFIGLALTLFPAFFVLKGTMDDDTYKLLMLMGTICWFATAPFWIFKAKSPSKRAS